MFDIKKFLNLTFYVSQLDQFLYGYRKTHHQLSASQRAEKEKYDRIFKDRDIPTDQPTSESVWEKF